MRIQKLSPGEFLSNCYVLTDGEESLVIDPSGEGEHIARLVSAAKSVKIVLTHCHADHWAAVPFLKKRFGAGLMMGRNASEACSKPEVNLAAMAGLGDFPSVGRWLDDGEIITVGASQLKTIFTPGHTSGSISLFMESEPHGILFTGDTLFAGGVGRTDLPTGDGDELRRSIRQRLFVFPGDTLVYPGHGGRSTVKREKEWGFLSGR